MSRAEKTPIHLPFEDRVLDNGLRVLLHEDRSVPVAALHLMYHVGSRNERPGRTGFAHLFEHLLFQGSQHVGDDAHFRHIQNAGGTLNGTTWFDRTNYFETVPSNELDLVLWLESDRMGYFLPAITQEKLDNQRDVVMNERRQSYENKPYGLAFETMLQTAYPEGHPYRHPTIGHMADIEAATLDDVREFFTTYYAPNNAVLVLAGDFEAADALRRVERYFGEIPSRPDPPPPPEAVRRPGGGRRATIEDSVQVSRVYLMYEAPAFGDPEFEAADVLTALLAEGKSSRLHRELVYDRRMAGEVHAFIWPTESTGMLWAVATGRPGVSADELEGALVASLDRLRGDGAGEDEVGGARNRTKRALVGRLAGVGDRADALAHAAVLLDDPGYVNAAFGRYAAIRAPDASRAAEAILAPERRTVVRVVPTAGEAA
ncbi:MAG: M16 family metallopeptidase [Gemmatimonadota bacterium]